MGRGASTLLFPGVWDLRTEMQCPGGEGNRVRETQGRGQGTCSGGKVQKGLGVVFRDVSVSQEQPAEGNKAA